MFILSLVSFSASAIVFAISARVQVPFLALIMVALTFVLSMVSELDVYTLMMHTITFSTLVLYGYVSPIPEQPTPLAGDRNTILYTIQSTRDRDGSDDLPACTKLLISCNVAVRSRPSPGT